MSHSAYNYLTFNEQKFWNVNVEAPSFDGYPNPDKFLNCVEGMDKYFYYYYDWSDERRVRFVKIKLLDKLSFFGIGKNIF